MKKYKIVAVLWNDHTVVRGSILEKKIKKLIQPSLTIGALYYESDSAIWVLSHLEKFPHDEPRADYTIIYKGSILGTPKEYGEIEISNLD